jgi:hypothetical protein
MLVAQSQSHGRTNMTHDVVTFISYFKTNLKVKKRRLDNELTVFDQVIDQVIE